MLEKLQSTAAGQRLLEGENIFVDPLAFLASLQAPTNRQDNALTRERPVYAHQQVYLDYRASVVAKILTLRDLRDISSDVRPDFLWIDTDRSGSDKLSLRLYMAGQHGAVPVRLAPAGCEQSEPRFIVMEPARGAEAADRLARIVGSGRRTSGDRLARFENLRHLIEADGTLADLSRRLTDFVLDETLAFQPRPVLVSDLIASGALIRTLEAILNRLPEFIATFNERVRALRALDIEPQVKPLAHDYLPLFITFAQDARRVRLRLVRDGGMSFACAVDHGGREHRYELGACELSIGRLGEDVRWSPDVTLPMLVNDHYSGMVAGRSSGLYMLVFADVMRKVLDMTPIPLVIPSNWDVFPSKFDSLFDAYLDGRSV